MIKAGICLSRGDIDHVVIWLCENEMKEDIRVHENYIYLIRSGNVFFFGKEPRQLKAQCLV